MVRIVVHGGAGTISDEDRKLIAEKGVIDVIKNGHDLLKTGATALDVVQNAVREMEDNPIFNAGLGSVLTADEKIEMDALLMDGKTMNIGGVIAVSRIQNPILLCRSILENSKHLIFTGKGAEKFAQLHGFELINNSELVTDRIRERYQKFKEDEEKLDSVDPEGRTKYGTVGAVAIDENGDLAAATSTGGVLGKQYGRVGDTPIVGAGTYADDHVAISATGVGEYIIQGMLAMRIRYMREKFNLDTATRKTLEFIQSRFGPAGAIAIDKEGNWSAQKTTQDLVFAMKDDNEVISFLQDKVLN